MAFTSLPPSLGDTPASASPRAPGIPPPGPAPRAKGQRGGRAAAAPRGTGPAEGPRPLRGLLRATAEPRAGGSEQGVSRYPLPGQAPAAPAGPIAAPAAPSRGQPQPRQPGDISFRRKKTTNNSTLGFFPRRACLEDEQEAKRFLLPKTFSQKGTKLIFFFLKNLFASNTFQIIKKREQAAAGRGWRGGGGGRAPHAGGCTALCLRCGCCRELMPRAPGSVPFGARTTCFPCSDFSPKPVAGG